MTQLERFVASPVAVLTLVDLFASTRGTRGLNPGPIPPVRFQLIARREAAGLVALDPVMTLVPTMGASGAYIFADQSRRNGAAPYRIAPGTYRLRIETDYYQTLEIEIAWPPPGVAAPPIELKPSVAYPFPDITLSSTRLTILRGVFAQEMTSAPVVGARVELVVPPNLGPFTDSLTDANGGWVLVFPASAADLQATVRFTSTDDPNNPVVVSNVVIVSGIENSLAQTAVRGAVVSAGGAPIANAEITLSGRQGSVRSARDGRWTFYLSFEEQDRTVRVTATAPNGSSSFQDVEIHNRATVVAPTIQIQ